MDTLISGIQFEFETGQSVLAAFSSRVFPSIETLITYKMAAVLILF